ncbi:hypothetical protein PIB30_081940 [Stylosanthes scabra]|uniref:Uncharacterized protein n=1 Tax=Stylosanthes scabra TaxID=79078 RepID=A0ABU6RT01_9FABA|nr:hypothetical protein [Stylosanthes scabra]
MLLTQITYSCNEIYSFYGRGHPRIGGSQCPGQTVVKDSGIEQEAVGEAYLESPLRMIRYSASTLGSCTSRSKPSSTRRPPATESARWTLRNATSCEELSSLKHTTVEA